MRPVSVPSVLLSPSDTGYDAFDTASLRLHHLNATAALILELCDGTRTLDDLRETLLPVAGDTGWTQCLAWLEQAMADGLICDNQNVVRRFSVANEGNAEASHYDGTAASHDDSNAEPSTLRAAQGRSERSRGTTGSGSSRARSRDEASHYRELARGLRKKGRILEAFICQEHASALAPENPDHAYALGELAHILGRRDVARTAYEHYLVHCPGDAEIAHILMALRDEPPPPRASSACIEQLYSRFAASYNENMTGDLEYQAPGLLEGAVSRATNRTDLTILDLGCGTGLSGQSLRPHARQIIGVDLSHDMIQQAGQSGVYDALHVAEITEWLAGVQGGNRVDPGFDLIVACDALIYFADLRQVLMPAAALLKPGGLVAFTVERGDTVPFRLTDSGRFTHHERHIRDVAEDARLAVVSLEEAVLRYEYGVPVAGLVTVLEFKT